MRWIANILKIILFVPSILCLADGGQLKPYEKGKLAASLGFGAMTIDAYYDACFSNGYVLDNNLNGIDQLLKEKWGFSFSKKVEEQGLRAGRNYRNEAHVLVRTMLQKTGGCNSSGAKQWFRQFQGIHENNLRKFHNAK